MKVLSNLDGASKVVQDTNNRFVSDEEKSKLAIELGVAVPNNDLNQALTTGIYHYVPNAANSPWADGYGFLHVLVSAGLFHNNASNWITQMAYPLFNQAVMYRRDKVNNDAWSGWTIWQASDSTKANLSGADFTGHINGTSAAFSSGVSANHLSHINYAWPTELGKYIDYHEINSSYDYDVRSMVEGTVLSLYSRDGTQQGRILTKPAYIAVSSSRDFALTDANNTLLFDTTPNPLYLKIRNDSVVNFPIGTIIKGRKINTTGYVQILYDAGVLVQGLAGSYAQLFGIEKIAANQWTASVS